MLLSLCRISLCVFCAFLLIAAMPLQGRHLVPTGQFVLVEVNEFFIDVLGDVPLHDAITVDYDSLLIFDKPDGRYVELVAYIADGAGAAEIEQFYSASLPMLGWRNKGRNIYARQNELLKLSFVGGESARFLRFEVSPEKK